MPAASAHAAPPADYLTTAEVAAVLGRPIATVNRWARTGRLPVAGKLPGRTGANLYRRADVEQLLNEPVSA